MKPFKGLDTAEEYVRFAMNKYLTYRLHKNRMSMYIFLKKKGYTGSYSTMTRAQRKLWENGECLPQNSKDRKEWRKIRNELSEEFRAYAKQ